MNMIGGLFGILMALTIWAGMIALFFYIAYRVIRTAVKHGIMDAYDEIHKYAYSARTAHPFQRNGAPFRFKLSKAQQVD